MATLLAERSTYWIVSGGSNPNAYGDYRYYWKVFYEQTDNDKSNNRSKVIIEYYIQKHKTQVDPDTGMDSVSYPSGGSTAYINGSSIGTINSSSGTIMIGTSWALSYLGTKNTYVSHNQNGTGSFTFRATGFGKGTSTTTYNLPTIPRNSTLGDIQTFTVDTGLTVSIMKKVDTYYDKLQIYQSVNGSNSLIKTIEGISNGDSVTFTNSELNTIYENASENYGVFTFTLSTYSDGSYTTQVGSSVSKTANGNLVIVAPTFSAFTYIDSNSTTTTLTGNSLKIVKGKSTLKITLTNAQKAVANTRGASISHYVVNGQTIAKATLEGSDGYSLENYSSDNVVVYAVDTRNTSSNQVAYSFVANNVFVDYQEVSKGTTQSYTRSDNGIGKFVDVSFDGTWWNGNFGSVINTLYGTFQYKKSTETNYTNATQELTLTTTSGGNNFSFNGRIYSNDTGNQGGFDVSESYDIIITVKDVNKDTPLSSDTIIFSIHSGEPAIAIYKNKTALGAKYDETLGGIQFWGNTYLNGDLLYIPIIPPIPTAQDLNVYSTTETIIGNYNNKPLYRKIVDFGSLPNGSATKSVAHTISNLDMIRDIRIMGYDNSGTDRTWFPIPFAPVTYMYNNTSCSARIVGDNITIYSSSDWSNYTAMVTLEYTKTTD